MKTIFFLFEIISFTSYLQAQNKGMSFQNTIKIENGDSEDAIIERAAHVIPTPNQLTALQNEFIDFRNLKNDPSKRFLYLKKMVMARYVWIKPLLAGVKENVDIAELDLF